MERTIHQFRAATSTQAVAHRLVERGVARVGDIVIAETQTAGRGRFGRTWISPQGGIYATIICPGGDPLLAVKAGMSVIGVLRAAGVHAAIKWPNDILVDGKKLAGVLIESDGKRALVGFGMNVTSSPLRTSTRLADYTDSWDPQAWIGAVADALFEGIESPFDMGAYRRVCITLGSHVRIEEAPAGETRVEGVAVDIDNAGRLIVSTEAGRKTISSGDCFHLHAVHRDA